VRNEAQLPGQKPAKPTMPFEVGAKVLLKSCPSDVPGIVCGMQRERVIVQWPDLNYTGRHKADSLMLADGTASEKEDHDRN
jgi:hypothetical protein